MNTRTPSAEALLAVQIKRNQDIIAILAKKLATNDNPLMVLAWSNDAITAAANIKVMTSAVRDLNGGITVADLRAGMTQTVLNTARFEPASSANSMHGTCDQAERMALANLLSEMERW